MPTCDSAMFITSYGAYEISSDPGFAVSRISMSTEACCMPCRISVAAAKWGALGMSRDI